METIKTTQLVDDIVERADRLRHDVDEVHESGELMREIYSLRRSVETLEREVRGDSWGPDGDAC